MNEHASCPGYTYGFLNFPGCPVTFERPNSPERLSQLLPWQCIVHLDCHLVPQAVKVVNFTLSQPEF